MNESMMVISVLGLVVASFVATNIDNLALLVGWLVSKQVALSRIFAGYMTGMFILLLLSIIISFVSFVIPLSYLGFFGVIPLLMGFIMLLRLVRVRIMFRLPTSATPVIQWAHGFPQLLITHPL